MPYRHPLPERYAKEGWSAKIQDKERVEPPHVTLRKGALRWRIELRTGRPMDGEPPPRDVPKALLTALLAEASLATLVMEWNRRYPENEV